MNENNVRAMEIANKDDGQHGALPHGQHAAEQHAGCRQTWPPGQNSPAPVAGMPQASANEHRPGLNMCAIRGACLQHDTEAPGSTASSLAHRAQCTSRAYTGMTNRSRKMMYEDTESSEGEQEHVRAQLPARGLKRPQPQL